MQLRKKWFDSYSFVAVLSRFRFPWCYSYLTIISKLVLLVDNKKKVTNTDFQTDKLKKCHTEDSIVCILQKTFIKYDMKLGGVGDFCNSIIYNGNFCKKISEIGR